jgi:hypothetical protein
MRTPHKGSIHIIHKRYPLTKVINTQLFSRRTRGSYSVISGRWVSGDARAHIPCLEGCQPAEFKCYYFYYNPNNHSILISLCFFLYNQQWRNKKIFQNNSGNSLDGNSRSACFISASLNIDKSFIVRLIKCQTINK